jgi:excinuclease ABC subunit C
LNDWFQLRDCSQAQEMVFADQAEMFPVLRAAGCLRYEIGTCLGPCTGSCSLATYAERVAAARSFLAGADTRFLQALERDMQAASAQWAFEKAAALRDKLDALAWLHRHLDRLRQARRQFSFVYPVGGAGGRDLWYLIQSGRTVAVVAAPHDGASTRSAAEAVRKVFRSSREPNELLSAGEMDGLLLIISWFRRYPEERNRTLKPAEALAKCRALR